MRIEYESLSDVVPADRNPKGHDIPNIKQSIRRFGFVQPLLRNEKTGKLLGGHGRLEALEEMLESRESIPGRIKKVGDQWAVPVIRGIEFDTDAEAEAYLLADNQLTIAGGWVDGELAEMLPDIPDLTGVGFSDEDIAEILSPVPEIAFPDSEPEPPDDGEETVEIDDKIEPEFKTGESQQIGKHTLHCGDCVEVLSKMGPESVDAIVCDPPYGINMMGAAWDCSVPGEEWAKECLRVLKPGGHLIAFAATRTVHRLAVVLEDAGMEIRDCIHWAYHSGFPKGFDVSKAIDAKAGVERPVVGTKISGIANPNEKDRHTIGASVPVTVPVTVEAKKWNGWNVALKPAVEPAVLARRPLDGTVAENVLKHGTGAMNIDACRYAHGDPAWPGPQESEITGWGGAAGFTGTHSGAYGLERDGDARPTNLGRWPANLFYCPKPAVKEKEAGMVRLRVRDDLSADELAMLIKELKAAGVEI